MDYFARCSSGNKDIDKELAQKFIESMHKCKPFCKLSGIGGLNKLREVFF